MIKTSQTVAGLLLILFFGACERHQAEPVSDQETVRSRYVRRTNSDTAIVFVHGVFGGAKGTWTNEENGAYWPELLLGDGAFAKSDVYVYSYSTPYLGQSYTIDELVENMRLILSNDEVFEKHKRVVFLSHSMGGLVVRGFLKRYQANAAQVPLIYFFSTPTAGAQITRLGRFLTRNPQLRGMLPANSEDYVSNLKRDWRALPHHINSRCAYEKLDTHGMKIVDEESATALCDGPVDPMDRDHISIVKPKDKNDLPYIAFRQAFLQGVEVAAQPSETIAGLLQTGRSVDVDCGQVRENTAVVPPPIELKPEQKVVDAVASLQEASNLKEQEVRASGLVNQMAKVHYRLVGLDRSTDGSCAGKGKGVILVSFVVSQPVDMKTVGFTPLARDSLFVALSARSGTLRIQKGGILPSIAASVDAYATRAAMLMRSDVSVKGAD